MTKEIRKNKHEDAVSPVIGVILMVVITVIIAAILAVFAFGIGSPAKAPETNLKYTAVFDSTATTSTLTISHQGGDALILKDEKMTVTFAKDGTDAINTANPTPVAVALDGSVGTWQTIPLAGLDTLAAGQNIGGLLDPTAITGEILNVQIVDVPTGQIISSTKVVVQ